MTILAQPCPHCAGDNIEVVTDGGRPESPNLVAYCHDCFSQGPPASDDYHALKFWNERA